MINISIRVVVGRGSILFLGTIYYSSSLSTLNFVGHNLKVSHRCHVFNCWFI